MPASVLIIDDDPVQRRLIEAQISAAGFYPILREGGAAGIELLGNEGSSIAAVVLDLVMPGVGGLEVLAEMRRLGCRMPVIVQTAKGGTETVVEAMRAGAFDFVVKPVAGQKLRQVVSNAVRVGAARSGRAAEATGAKRATRALIEPGSPAMEPILALAQRAAHSSIPILIEGETGVGKEWLAEAIRAAGPRAKKPFVTVNCGALPGALAESILFGHEKGAFTDAGERHRGKFVEADGGTLFLDEVGELPAALQVKLLRALQKGEIDPVGGRSTVTTNVRVISATNRDLASDVRAGRFREDLYYRLNVLPIRIPPLRQRRAEIADLAARFLVRFGKSEGRKTTPTLSGAALDLLRRHDWPGNVRQLQNAIHRAVVLSDADILGVADFPQIEALVAATDGETVPLPPEASPRSLPSDAAPERAPPGVARQALDGFDEAGEVRSAEAVEADLIRLAMRHYKGHMSEVARRLGIGRSTLYRKMRRYSIAESGASASDGGERQSLRETKAEDGRS